MGFSHWKNLAIMMWEFYFYTVGIKIIATTYRALFKLYVSHVSPYLLLQLSYKYHYHSH